MKTFPLKSRAAMIRNSSSKPRFQFSAIAGALTLSVGCLISSGALAQSPDKNTADLNFVGADIESVVKAIGHYTSEGAGQSRFREAINERSGI